VHDREQLLLTIPDAARRLGIGRSTLYELIAAGAIETVRIGRARRIPVTALAAFVESLRRSA
jgi:excisionase family DNA binding protein